MHLCVSPFRLYTILYFLCISVVTRVVYQVCRFAVNNELWNYNNFAYKVASSCQSSNAKYINYELDES